MVTRVDLEHALKGAEEAEDTQAVAALRYAIDQGQYDAPVIEGYDNYEGPSQLGTAARGFLQGASFGFGDELASYIQSKMPGEERSYDEILGQERQVISKGRDDYPVTAIGSEVTGALVPAAATWGAGSALSGGNAVKTGVQASKPLWTTAAKSAGWGAVNGGLYGFGTGEGDINNRLASAGMGGFWGGVGGGVAVPITMGGSALARGLYNRIASRLAPPEAQAAQRIYRTMQQGRLGPQQVQKTIDDLGPEGMLMDALDEPGYALARGTADINPSARDALQGASRQRMAGQVDRMTDRLQTAGGLSGPRTLKEIQDEIWDEARPAIKKAYDEARAKGYDIDFADFEDLMRSKLFATAKERGTLLARERAVAEASRYGRVTDDALGNGPSPLDILDETKKTLDARAAPNVGQRPTNEQDIAAQLARTVRERIDDVTPEYGGARDLVRQRHARLDATELGAEGAKTSVPADYARRVAQSADEVRPDIAQAYASGKIDKLQNRRTTPGAIDTMFGSARQQQALDAALGPNAGPVRQQVAAEQVFGRTDRALTGNSKTNQFLNDSANAARDAFVGGAAGGDAVSGGVGGIALLMAQRGGKALKARAAAGNEQKVAPALAQLLLGRQVPEAVRKQAEKEMQRSPVLQRLFWQAISGSAGLRGEQITDAVTKW